MDILATKKHELTLAIQKVLVELGSAKNAVVGGSVDPITNELDLIRGDGTRIPLGAVGKQGDPGTDGVSVINIKLIEDPLQDNNVFLQTELSDGTVLQTTNSLNGYHGKSIESATVDQLTNEFIFVLEGGQELARVPVSGLAVRSVDSARIENGEIVWEMSDGTEVSSVGMADALAGRGIDSIVREANGEIKVNFNKGTAQESLGILRSMQSAGFTADGKLELTMDNGETIDLGKFLKFNGVSIVNGELVFSTNQTGDEATINLGPLTSLTGAAIENGNEVVFYTNQPAPNDKFNIGPVDGLRGKDGIGVKDVNVEDDHFVITLDDDRVIRRLVSGISPISVTGARFDDEVKDLFLKLSDGTEISTGFKGDIKGDSIAEVQLDASTGELKVRFDNEQALRTVGVVPVITSYDLQANGDLYFKWSHQPSPTKLGNIKQMIGVERDPVSGEILVTFNDNPDNPTSLGFIKSVESISIDGDDLLVMMTGDTEPQVIGSLRGPKGDDGIDGTSVANPRVRDEDGHLELDLVDAKGNVTTEDVGRVRMTIQNVLGQQYEFVATAGQTDFRAPHDGQVLMYVNKELVSKSDRNLDVKDNVKYTGPALAEGDKVTIISFVSGGPSETGRGIFNLEGVDANTYRITLEDGTTFLIDTETDVQPQLDAATIDKVEVISTGELILKFKDGTTKNAGFANKAINTKDAYIKPDGTLMIVLDDDSEFPAGNVLTNVEVSGARIDERGHLFIQMSGGGEYDAGFVATYPTKAEVGADSILRITLSDGKVLEAGMVRNPLLGSIKEFIAYEGQTKFPLKHANYGIWLTANGFDLPTTEVDLSDPNNITLAPRKSGDVIRVLLTTDGGVWSKGIEGEEDAASDTYYGKDENGKVGFHKFDRSLVARPVEATATYDGQTMVNINIAHQSDVFLNGLLLDESKYTKDAPNRSITFTSALTLGDKIRVVNYVEPNVANGFLVGDYNRIAFRTFNPGGSFNAGDWRVRQLNQLLNNSNGLQLDGNRLILPAGKWYLRGYAIANGVGQNALKLYNESMSQDLIPPLEACWAPVSAKQYDTSDAKCEIKGYFETTQEVAVVLMHKCTISRQKVGFGNGTAYGGNTFNKGDLKIPGNLVDLELWKVG